MLKTELRAASGLFLITGTDNNNRKGWQHLFLSLLKCTIIDISTFSVRNRKNY